MSGRNKTKQVMLGVLFSVPLAIALIANPPGWTAAGIAIAVALAIAIYYLAAVLVTSDSAWNDIHQVAHVLSEQDLRAASLPPDNAVTPTNRAGRGQMGQLYQALRVTHANLSELAGQASRSAAVARVAADRLAADNVNLSQRTEDEASTPEEIAASIEEPSATGRQYADTPPPATDLPAAPTGKAPGGAGGAGRGGPPSG